jgi:uncharacterized protein
MVTKFNRESNMKIVAFADIHGAFEVLPAALERERPFDAIVLAGDLTTFGTPAHVRRSLPGLQDFGVPVLCVGGNMDPLELEEEFSALATSLNGRGVMLREVGFFGLSGAPVSPLKTPHELPEEELLALAERGYGEVKGAKWIVFVPHAPPYNTKLDRTRSGLHVGSRAVRTIIERYQPAVTICGHIHESRGIDALGASAAVNCGPAGRGSYAVVMIDNELRIELRDGEL